MTQFLAKPIHDIFFAMLAEMAVWDISNETSKLTPHSEVSLNSGRNRSNTSFIRFYLLTVAM